MTLHHLRRSWCGYRRDTTGAASVELALTSLFLILPLLSITDLSFYAYRKMQVENAAQQAVQAAWATCKAAAQQPAINNCANLATAVNAGLQSTSLGNKVTEASGFPKDGYYCATTSGTLTLVGTIGSGSTAPTQPSPFTCDAVAGHSAAANTAPSEYVQIKATYTFNTIFNLGSIGSLFPSPITKTVWTRLD